MPAARGHSLELLQRATEQLAEAAPWQARALFGTARAIADLDAGLARQYTVTAMARFAAMGMEADRRAAQALLLTLT